MRQILVTSASTENLFGHMLPYRHFFGINVLSSLYWAQEKAAATKPVSERTRVQAKVSQGGDGLLLAPEQCQLEQVSDKLNVCGRCLPPHVEIVWTMQETVVGK